MLNEEADVGADCGASRCPSPSRDLHVDMELRRRHGCSVKAIQISASRLGEVVMDDLCERCYWLKLHLNHHLPFQIFPSIFSSIDSYTKDIVHSWFEAHGVPPVYGSPTVVIVVVRTVVSSVRNSGTPSTS
jgi:hypothetical protein